jgi:hypothetical protein
LISINSAAELLFLIFLLLAWPSRKLAVVKLSDEARFQISGHFLRQFCPDEDNRGLPLASFVSFFPNS